MQITPGLTAFVTGAGSGIGGGIARRLAARGVRVGVVDIRAEAADETVESIRRAGGTALGLSADVSDLASLTEAADRVEAELGPVSIVCNNAGVAMHGVPLHEIAMEEWDWVIGVNLYGVIHGIRTFLPRLLRRGGAAHVVNTASIGGFQVNAGFLTGPYSATKYAVVALSEALRNETAGTDIGVSVLAPAAVDTGIHLSERSRPDRLGGPTERPQNHFLGDLIRDGARPDDIGRDVVAAIEDGRFYIFTHAETVEWLKRRFDGIRDGFAAMPPLRAAAE